MEGHLGSDAEMQANLDNFAAVAERDEEEGNRLFQSGEKPEINFGHPHMGFSQQSADKLNSQDHRMQHEDEPNPE